MSRFVVAFAAFAVLAGSCSSTTPAEDNQPAAAAPMDRSPAARPAAHLGETLDLMRIGDQQIAVTLLQVINPATVPNGWGDPAKTYAAVKLKIANTGTTTITGNGNSDVQLIGSDNQEYHADFATVTECRDFVYGWFLIPMGASVTGCVTFALPHGVAPVRVKYTPSSGISHDVGEWLNP